MQGRSPGLNTCPQTPLTPWIFSRAPVGQPTSGVWGKEACVCRRYKPASRDPEQAERGVGVSQGGPRRTRRTPCPTPAPGQLIPESFPRYLLTWLLALLGYTSPPSPPAPPPNFSAAAAQHPSPEGITTPCVTWRRVPVSASRLGSSFPSKPSENLQLPCTSLPAAAQGSWGSFQAFLGTCHVVLA